LSVSVHFSGFSPKAFEAFEPHKWASNRFNLERMMVRDQLRALGSLLEPALCAGRTLEWDVTPHVPNIFNAHKVQELVLYFTRTDAEKKAILPLLDSRISLPEQLSDAAEHHRHATLAVRIAQDGLLAGLAMHSTAWLDVMNLLNRCRNPLERSQFLALVRDLPRGSEVVVAPGRTVRASEFEASHLHDLEDAVLNETFLIWFGVRFEASSPVVQGSAFLPVCRDALLAAAPLYDFVAWRKASDYLSIAEEQRRLRDQEHAEVADLFPGARVRVTDGPFCNREGVVTELDHRGFVKVLIGKVTLRTEGRLVRLLATPGDRGNA